MLDGTGWLPEPLRLAEVEAASGAHTDPVEALPEFLAGDEDAEETEEPQPHAVAAE
jgi:ParB family chromosome partitioning protein